MTPESGAAAYPDIIVARYAGFCFGVKRAVDKVMKLAGEKLEHERIYTLGKLIHNASVVAELEALGVRAIGEDELDAVFAETGKYPRTTIVIRTHGVSSGVCDKLYKAQQCDKSLRIVDCTCPDVKKIHRLAYENTDGRLLLIIGNHAHPEVEGIRSYARGETVVCGSLDELTGCLPLFEGKALTMVSQTTQNMNEWKTCQKFIQKVCTNARIFDTICSVTENRQAEVDSLSRECGLMLIVGDRESSNTNKLYKISKSNLDNTVFLQTPDELHSMLRGGTLRFPDTAHFKVGIAAGASTPSGIIEEVVTTMNNEKLNTPAGEGSESFAEMLENYSKTLNTGDTVKGTITSITPSEMHVDLGSKVTGIIPVSELTDDPSIKFEDRYHVGDEIEAVAVKVSDIDGVATLSRRRIESKQNWDKIVSAFNDGTILEGKIVEVVKSGVIINLNGTRVFIPASHSSLPKDSDLATLVGTTQRVKIIDLNEQRKRAVASIREVAREERKAKAEEFWKTIEIGRKYEGVVKSLTSYGAFVDLGGVDGMVHSSELSWKRIKHPSEIVSVGETVNVYVKDFDPETKRISLGYKTEESNPWNVFTAKYAVGDTATVKIVSMMPFGAFAEVVPGTDGLIHISQIAKQHINQPSDVLTLGQEVDVKIIDIDMDNHKISLSMTALMDDDNGADEE